MFIARPSVCANGIPATASQFEPLGADKLAVVRCDASIITPASNIYRFATNHTTLYLRYKSVGSSHLIAGCGDKKCLLLDLRSALMASQLLLRSSSPSVRIN